MATEVSSASPRISFSQDILAAAAAAAAVAGDSQGTETSLLLEPGAGDFNFNIGFQISADDSSNADELFSDGKILPFFKTPGPAEKNPCPPNRPILDRRGSLRQFMESATRSSDDNAFASSDRRGSFRRSFWRFGRSSSVGSAAEPVPIFTLPLHRSKSTGSVPNPARRRPQVAASMVSTCKIRPESNQRKTYYYSGSQRGSHGAGVRISPILNVPAPMISTGGGGSGGSGGITSVIFAYLLCNCGGEGRRDEIGDEISASQQNGTIRGSDGRAFRNSSAKVFVS